MRNMPADKAPVKRINVPTAVAIFPRDMVPVPRVFAERVFNVQQWTNMPEGGRFAAMEKPGLLAEDIIQFVSKRRQQARAISSIS